MPSIARAISSLDAANELEPFASDALAGAIRKWILHLAVVRVTAPDREAMLEGFDEPADESSPRTMSEHVRALLGGPADRALAARLLPDGHAKVMDPSLRWFERAREARRRAGIAVVDARPLAEEVVSSLAGLDEEPLGWLDAIERGLSRTRGEGWPTYLTPRTLGDLVGRAWFDGVRLPPIKLPAPIGVSSFVRALSDVGWAYASFDRDRTKPFSLCRAPVDPLVRRRASLFGSLALSTSFHQRRFGVAAHVAREEVRAIARAKVTWLRMDALAVLMEAELLSEHRAQAFEELTHRIFGRPWPGRLAAVVPRLREDAAERFVGTLRAETDRRVLRDQFDEDWFDNPRAVVTIRHEHHLAVHERPEAPPDLADAKRAVDRVRETLDG